MEQKSESDTESLLHTKIPIIKHSLTWSIDNFICIFEKTGQRIISPVFPADKNDGPKWCIHLVPRNSDECPLSLFLESANCTDDLWAKFRFSLLIASGKEVNIHQSGVKKFTADNRIGFRQFIRRCVLEEKAKQMLPGNKLTLRCEVTILADPITIAEERITNLKPDLSLSEAFGEFFKRQRLCDVILRSKDGQELAAHKAILAARSSVFADMFECGMCESVSGIVDMTGMSYELLNDMLIYIYTGNVKNVDKKTEDLFMVADKYQLAGLKSMCEELLSKTVTAENAVKLLILADVHSAKLLKAEATNFISLHSSVVIGTDIWTDMEESHPHLVAEILRVLTAKVIARGPPKKKMKF